MTNLKPQELSRLAEASGGCFDRTDAHAAGFDNWAIRRRLNAESWVELLPDVFRSSTSPVTRDMQEHAALKRLGPDSFLSHGSAAGHHGFAQFPDRVWASVPHRVNVPAPDWLEVTRTRHPAHQTLDNGLRVAEPARAMADLAMVLGQRDLTAALATAVQAETLTIADVETQVKLLAGRAGTADMRSVLVEFNPDFESILSADLFDLFDLAGITGVVPKVKVALPNGKYALLDGAIPELRQGFEADGFAHHGTAKQQAADRARDVQLGLVMWRVTRFNTHQLRRERAETRRLLPRIVEARRRELRLAS